MPNVGEDQINAAKDTFMTLLDISRLLGTGLDPDTLTICIRLIEAGVNPEALATVIRELRRESATVRENARNDFDENQLD